MHTVTLITNPAMVLDPALVAKPAQRDGRGGDVVWLDPNHAAEFEVARLPKNLEPGVGQSSGRRRGHGRAALRRAEEEDAAGRHGQHHDPAGMRRRNWPRRPAWAKAVSAITEKRAMNGELDFEAALIERVGLLKGLSEDTIAKVLSERITPMPGGATLVATMKAHGARAVLVSGGFVSFTSVIAEQLGFDEHRANTLLAESGVLTGDVARPILGRDAKVQALRRDFGAARADGGGCAGHR